MLSSSRLAPEAARPPPLPVRLTYGFRQPCLVVCFDRYVAAVACFVSWSSGHLFSSALREWGFASPPWHLLAGRPWQAWRSPVSGLEGVAPTGGAPTGRAAPTRSSGSETAGLSGHSLCWSAVCRSMLASRSRTAPMPHRARRMATGRYPDRGVDRRGSAQSVTRRQHVGSSLLGPFVVWPFVARAFVAWPFVAWRRGRCLVGRRLDRWVDSRSSGAVDGCHPSASESLAQYPPLGTHREVRRPLWVDCPQ